MPDQFKFYSMSSDSPPGKGTGEVLESPNETYSVLRDIPNWRKILSNDGETPFEWKGETWQTAENAHASVKKGKKEALVDIWKHKFTGNDLARSVLLATGQAELWSGKTRWTDVEEIRAGLLVSQDSPKRNVQGKADMSEKKTRKVKTQQPEGQTPVQDEEPLVSSPIDITSNSKNAIATGIVPEDIPVKQSASATDVNLREELANSDHIEKARDSSIRFCTVCNNYLYLHVDETTGDLQRSCRNCGYKDIAEQGGLVSEMRIEQLSAEGYNLVNEFTLLDPRLPHLHGTIKCINSGCKSNKPGSESDIVYIKYDAENLRYIYICTFCKTNWRSRR
jgi:hypothetical protein